MYWNYLTDKKQKVIVQTDGPSAPFTPTVLIQGVPQGRILGPILFTLCITPVGDICRKHQIYFHAYVDDMQNHPSFKPTTSGNKELCRSNPEACISELWVWMCTNLLKLNDNKTEFILIGTRNILNMCGKMQITISDDTIDNVDSVKNLGIHFAKHLKNTIHINKLSSALFYIIKSIARVCQLLDQ